MTPLLATKAIVRGIHEHKRTAFTRRDPLDPQRYISEEINLGYFIHLDFGPESGPISVGVGPEVPANVTVGSEVIVAIFAPVSKKPELVR